MSSSNYKNLKEILNSLSQSLDALESGKLSVEQLSEVLEDARELHERIAILQYLSNLPKKEEKVEKAEEKVVTPPRKPMNFTFAFDEEPVVVPTNQTNLLDAIEKELIPEEPKVEFKAEIDTPKEQIEEAAKQNSESLNDKFSELAEKSSLADKLSKKPIEDLVKAIGLNQKFLFMNDLFEGENNYYKEAITNLNSFNSFIEADEYINTLRSRHGWETSNATVKEFVELVERRYS
jgi:hypothetical protein